MKAEREAYLNRLSEAKRKVHSNKRKREEPILVSKGIDNYIAKDSNDFNVPKDSSNKQSTVSSIIESPADLPMFGQGYKGGIDSTLQNSIRVDYVKLMNERFGTDSETDL